MVYNKARMNAVDNYKKKRLHRIPVDVKIDHFEDIKIAAEKSNQSVTGYVKQAIIERMEREGFLPDQDSNESK